MLISPGIYKKTLNHHNFKTFFLSVSIRKKWSIKLYAIDHPSAAILLQIKQASSVLAKFAMEKPKDQKHKEIVRIKKYLF
jgi:hypothetical protein